MGSATLTDKNCLLCEAEIADKGNCYAVIDGTMDSREGLFYENENEPPVFLICESCYVEFADRVLWGEIKINRLKRALAVLEGTLEGVVEGLMGRVAGMKWFQNELIHVHTNGSMAGTPLMDGASQSCLERQSGAFIMPALRTTLKSALERSKRYREGNE